MALESGMSVFTPFYQYSYTDLFQAHFNVEQVFCIHVIRAEDQMLAEPSFQFLHDDANQPFLLASRQLSQQSAECPPHQALVLARMSSCYVVQQTVHILDHQRAAVGTAWLQDEECCGSKVTGILIHTVRQLDEHSKNTHNSHFLVVSSTRWRPLLNVIKTCIFFTLDRPPTSGPVICGLWMQNNIQTWVIGCNPFCPHRCTCIHGMVNPSITVNVKIQTQPCCKSVVSNRTLAQLPTFCLLSGIWKCN